jgi:hypothetical protein
VKSGRLFRHGYVRSSRRRDQNDTLPPVDRHAALDYPGLIVKAYIWHDLRYRVMRGLIRPGDEQGVAALDDRFGDAGDLRRRLAEAEDDFGKPLPGRSMVVDASEAEVFERILPEVLDRATLGVGGIEAAVSNRREERPKRSEIGVGGVVGVRHGFSFDSTESGSLQ